MHRNKKYSTPPEATQGYSCVFLTTNHGFRLNKWYIIGRNICERRVLTTTQNKQIQLISYYNYKLFCMKYNQLIVHSRILLYHAWIHCIKHPPTTRIESTYQYRFWSIVIKKGDEIWLVNFTRSRTWL